MLEAGAGLGRIGTREFLGALVSPASLEAGEANPFGDDGDGALSELKEVGSSAR